MHWRWLAVTGLPYVVGLTLVDMQRAAPVLAVQLLFVAVTSRYNSRLGPKACHRRTEIAEQLLVWWVLGESVAALINGGQHAAAQPDALTGLALLAASCLGAAVFLCTTTTRLKAKPAPPPTTTTTDAVTETAMAVLMDASSAPSSTESRETDTLLPPPGPLLFAGVA